MKVIMMWGISDLWFKCCVYRDVDLCLTKVCCKSYTRETDLKNNLTLVTCLWRTEIRQVDLPLKAIRRSFYSFIIKLEWPMNCHRLFVA